MITVRSSQITEEEKRDSVPPLQWKFIINNGNKEELTVSDAFLDTEAAAKERALSEFIKNAYKTREINFKTLRTDLFINKTINVRGLPYLVKSVDIVVSNVSMYSNIKAVRYE